jgi:hypothetical protein
MPDDNEPKDINLDDYVPKTDHDKQVSEKDQTITQLQADLQKANQELLTPEYLEFLDSKKTPKPTQAQQKVAEGLEDLSTGDIDKMTNSQLVAHITRAVGEQSKAEKQELVKEIGNLRVALQSMSAEKELAEVRATYSDFDDYKDEIGRILKSEGGQNMTFEHAYRVAKSLAQEKSDGKDDPKKPDAPSHKGVEKPGGGVPKDDLKPKEYKDEKEAGDAAYDALKEKYPGLGDTI